MTGRPTSGTPPKPEPVWPFAKRSMPILYASSGSGRYLTSLTRPGPLVIANSTNCFTSGLSADFLLT